MATYIKFLAGDYGKEEYIYIKNKNQLRCSSKMFGAKELFLSSIASCEVANEESVKKLGGTLGGALVGGVLLGGIGAVAGAVAGGKTTESTVIIEFKNGNKALAKVNSPMMEVIRAYLFLERDFRRVTQGTYPELLRHVSPSGKTPVDALIQLMTAPTYTARQNLESALDDMRLAIRAAKTANRLMLG